MKYAIIADIHSNLAALNSVLEVLRAERVDRIYCLGDIVGYNANPLECVQTVRSKGIISLQGNHERAVLGGSMDDAKPETLQAIEFTRRQLPPDQLAFLKSLPEQLHLEERILLVHGSPRNRDEYILNPRAISDNLRYVATECPGIDLCFYGHTHIPLIVGAGKVFSKIHKTTTYKLERFRTYLINPGSVGQPRDNCPLSSFAVLDLGEHAVTIHRKEYDVRASRDRVIEAGLSPLFADRLVLGR